MLETKVALKKGFVLDFIIFEKSIQWMRQFLMRVRPHKIEKVDIEKLGKLKSQYDTKVKGIKYIGKEEIVVMETDTRTFIANGYAMHRIHTFHVLYLSIKQLELPLPKQEMIWYNKKQNKNDYQKNYSMQLGDFIICPQYDGCTYRYIIGRKS